MSQLIEITADDLTPLLGEVQQEAVDTRPNAGSEDDPLTVSIEEAVSRVRAEVRSNEGNVLSPNEALVPPELKVQAVLLVIEGLERRIPGFLLTQNQVDDIAQAKLDLEDVRGGVLAIEAPDDAPAAESPADVPGDVALLRSRENPLSGKRLRGL